MKFLLFQFTLTIVFMFIFLKGYFPFTHHEATILQPPTEIEGIPLDLNKFYQPQIQRLVLIIIDALRYDFITQDNMPFLHSNMHCLIKVKVEAPTVTLPRIKALTTGAVPQFIDIVLNLGAKAKVADSFLHRAHASGKRMVFYGDNTWLMMFPELFERYEGTTSFFVNDFTEVDDNVTRNIQPELMKEWDMMFLHYLGLDHIGHIKGPFSSFIQPKLHEMDNVIKEIITSSNSWDQETIIMITGDHGMKDSGGHGGTTYAETHVPLVLHHNKGIKCDLHSINTIIQQSDIANTISALFGIAMPANSAGKVLTQLLNSNKAQLLYTLHYNSLLLERNAENLNNCRENLTLARLLFKNAVQSENFNSPEAQRAEIIFKQCLNQISDELIESSVKQDAVLLVFGLVASINCLFIMNFQFKHEFISFNSFISLCSVILVLFSFSFDFYAFQMQIIPTTIISGITLVIAINLLLKLRKFKEILLSLLQLLPILAHGAFLPSSSYIEEEQYIFYYFTCTASVLLAICHFYKAKSITLQTSMPLTVIEIIRISQEVENNKNWLLNDENIKILEVFHLISLILIVLTVFQLRKSKFWTISNIFIAFILILVHLHKFYDHFERSITFAQMIWLFIFVHFLVGIYRKLDNSFLISWILVMSFQLRAYNMLLLPAIVFCSIIVKKSILNLNFRNRTENPQYFMHLKCSFLVLLHIWLGYTFFFLQGHRNSIANIDLAPGYLGLSSYVPFLVGLLTISHSYGFQTLSLLLLFEQTSETGTNSKIYLKEPVKIWRLIFGYKLFILLVIYVVIFINRGHLFVWSVFAPKLLIECMHTFILYLQMLLYCGCRFIDFVKCYKFKKL